HSLTQDAGVSERVAAGLRPDAETVRSRADMDAGEQLPAARRDRVDLGVVPSGEPECLAVRGDAAHVWAAAARNAPLRDLLAGAEADDGDRPFAAVAHVEALAVAARIEAVRTRTRCKEADDPVAVRVDFPDAIGLHVGDVKDGAVRRKLDVLRHATTAGREGDRAHDPLLRHVHDHQLP